MESYVREVRDLLEHVLVAEARSHEDRRGFESELSDISRKLDLLEDLVTVQEGSEDARLAMWVTSAI